jgi:hypothetical protein
VWLSDGFLDLLGDDRADFAEVFTDGLDLERGAEQKFQITFEVAGSLARLSGIEASADEMVDVNFGIFLPVTIHATIALLHAIRIPRDFVMD